MAAITTNKALDIASKMVVAAEQLITAFEAFASALDEKEGAGIDFADPDFVEALESSAIKHVDTAMLNNALSNSASIYAAMKAAFQDDVFQALRG